MRLYTRQLLRNTLAAELIGVALILALLFGCAAPPIENQTAAADLHLEDQRAVLSSAKSHLTQAALRLSAQPDPRHAGEELTATSAAIDRAIELGQMLQSDIAGLGGVAIRLKAQIASHQNDLLGPRGQRIRNRVIAIGVLVTLGIVLLQVGPLFGGPFGAGVIIAGHILTAFAQPALRGLWALLCLAGRAIASVIRNLIARLSGPVSSSSPAPAPATRS
jgi:hypothetical protein